MRLKQGLKHITSMVVPAEAAGTRLDVFVAGYVPSRTAAQRLIAAGQVTVNNRPIRRTSHRLAGGERLSFLLLPAEEEQHLTPEAVPLEILFEDRHLVVVNKPKGMVVHPGAGHNTGTLANALLHRYGETLSTLGGTYRPGIVHRLDKDTSGCLLVARNDEAHTSLAGQLKARSMQRVYLTLVYGVPPKEGTVCLPIDRHPLHRVKMAVVPTGREAVTHFRLLESFGRYALLRVDLETGRTHQIRVHLAHIGFPVVGDPLYAGNRRGISAEGQALHAWFVTFTHPHSHIKMTCVAPPPVTFAGLLDQLRARLEKT